MKYTYILPVIALLLIGVFTDMSAQKKRGTKKRESTTTREDTSRDKDSRSPSTANAGAFLQNLNSDVKIGNLNLSGNAFSIAAKVNSGYKVTDWFSAGVALKYQLFLFNSPGQTDDFSVHDFGAGVYARAKILQQFYAQVEYDVNNVVTALDTNNNGIRETFGSTYVGGGYLQGWGNWKFGAELLFILNDDLRDIQNSFLEYWFSASYNF